MLKYKSVVGLDRQRWKKETTRKQNARRILLRSALRKKKARRQGTFSRISRSYSIAHSQPQHISHCNRSLAPPKDVQRTSTGGIYWMSRRVHAEFHIGWALYRSFKIFSCIKKSKPYATKIPNKTEKRCRTAAIISSRGAYCTSARVKIWFLNRESD